MNKLENDKLEYDVFLGRWNWSKRWTRLVQSKHLFTCKKFCNEIKYIVFLGEKGDQGVQGPVGPEGPQGLQVSKSNFSCWTQFFQTLSF